jgi:hypothetical protein
MANTFPCPNPACTYEFDADQLPPAAMLTCPLCKTRFPYRAAKAAPAAQEPDDDNNPFATGPRDRGAGDEDRGGGRERDSAGRGGKPRPNRLVNPRHVPKSNKTQTTLLLVGVTAALAAVLAIVFVTMRRNPFKSDTDSPSSGVKEDLNMEVPALGKSWVEDPDTLRRLKGADIAAVARKKSDDSAWFVLYRKDYGKREPRPGEVRSEMAQTLNAIFAALQREPISGSVAGAEADAVRFDGELGGTQVVGEGYAFAHKGYGYVLLMWAPRESWDGARKELESLRGALKFANLRDNWRPEVQSVTPHFIDGGNYQLDDADGVWERAQIETEDKEGEEPKKKAGPRHKSYVLNEEQLKAKDPRATMAFRLTFPPGHRFAKTNWRPRPEALVLVLDDAGGDPLKAAADHVAENLRSFEGGDGVTIEFNPVTKSPSGTDVPKSEAAVGRYQTKNSVDKKAAKYYALAALKVGGKLVVAYAFCSDLDSEYLEPFLLHFVATLHERK